MNRNKRLSLVDATVRTTRSPIGLQGRSRLVFRGAVFAAVVGTGIAQAADKVVDRQCVGLRSVIALTSTEKVPVLPAGALTGDNWEIWLMNDDPQNPDRRFLTENLVEGVPPAVPGTAADFFAALSRKGRIVFDSNRDRNISSEPLNTTDLFLMNLDGSGQTRLTRGSSATWSPNGKRIAFHRSASFTVPGTGKPPVRDDAGAPSSDSDIFVAKVKDLLKGEEPTNLTFAEPRLYIHDDADWSPDGKSIAFTRHPKDDISNDLIRRKSGAVSRPTFEHPQLHVLAIYLRKSNLCR